MTDKRWNVSFVTAQLRITSLRLAQFQERQDSQGAIIRKDIATLLQQGNVSLARAKAPCLHRKDALGDLLEVLGMYVGQLLERFQELNRRINLSPIVIEAASTMIYAAQYVGLKDLEIVSHLLAQHLGPDFTRSAMTNNDGHVASIAIRTALPPSAKDLDLLLESIASEYGITWNPEFLRQDILEQVSQILGSQSAPFVDLPNLRRLCRHGIPDEPRWIRPRIWKLLFGVLSVVKASWAEEMDLQRSSYYGLVQRLLDPVSVLSPSDLPSNPLDPMLLNLSRQLSTTPSHLFEGLAQAPGSFSSCPLDDDAKDEIKLRSANNLNLRLDILHATGRTPLLPAEPFSMVITDPETLSTPYISHGKRQSSFKMTSLPFERCVTDIVHPKHFSALLRLLYVHASINPGNLSPRIASLLIPLYVVLNHEVIPDDLAHVEADTFWLFEAMVGEFSEIEDAEGGRTWMKKLSDRLAWADLDLFNDLQAKGLDPVLPHYSHEWLMPLLTHTLPLSCVLPIWDAVFSCPARTRDDNPKLDHLLNVCTVMLVCVRDILFGLGGNGDKSPRLWFDKQSLHRRLSPLHTWELGDDVLEGLTFLQRYPTEAAGGIDRILQGAFDLTLRRDEESKLSQETLSLGARITATMWKAFADQEPSPHASTEESQNEFADKTSSEDNSNETPSKTVPSLTLRLATMVWKGITNQTSMEPSPPNTPLSPLTSRSIISPSESGNKDILYPTSSIWEQIRDTDTMAALAKASSNLRAKSVLHSWRRSLSLNGKEHSWSPQIKAQREANGLHPTDDDEDNQTIRWSEAYSPLPTPQHFRSLRGIPISCHNKTPSPREEGNVERFIDKTYRLQSSLAALIRTSPSQVTAKIGPRPLLLSSSMMLTSPPVRSLSRSAGSSPAPNNSQWVDAMRLKGNHLHHDSLSSSSSLALSEVLRSAQSRKSGYSNTGTLSRRIPFNRKSMSPMAPSFAMSSGRVRMVPPKSAQIDWKSWKYAEKLDSASPSYQPSGMPDLTTVQGPGVHLRDPGVSTASSNQDTFQINDYFGSSTAQTLSRSPCPRAKRHAPQPLDLVDLGDYMERKLLNLNQLTVEWPSDDYETATTPRSSDSKVNRLLTTISSKPSCHSQKASIETRECPRKTSTEHETLTRKASLGQRSGKSYDERKDIVKFGRKGSPAEEGDDEEHDDLLSAYESRNLWVS